MVKYLNNYQIIFRYYVGVYILEYTVMCGNLQRVFNMGVHKYLDWEMSEGSDDEMAYLKRYENGTMRSRKGRNRQRSTSSKESCNNTDKENEEKLRECLDSR